MPLKDLRASALAVKASLRSTQASLEMLEQQLLVELQRNGKEEKLFQSALELIRDQQAFIASLSRIGTPLDVVETIRALDARASTFTFVENFPQTKKEATHHDK